MRRRTLLSLAGASSLSGLPGCSFASSSSSSPPIPDIEATEITARDRTCSDSQEGTATVESEGDDTLLITGRIAVPRIRDALYIDATNGGEYQDLDETAIEARIDFGPSDPRAATDVPECAGRIDYRAELAVSELPTEVVVRHTVEDEDGFRLGTIAEQPID